MEDRKRLLALPYVQQTSPIVTSTNTSTTAVLKPKPILVDKQLSEPSSPITKSFKDSAPPVTVMTTSRRPMQRGFSDLGNRIKKRVTLRFAITQSTFVQGVLA